MTLPASNTYNFNLKYFDIIRLSNMKAGYQQSELSVQDMDICFNQINLIYTDWISRFQIQSTMLYMEIPLMQGQTQITMPPSCIDVIDPIVVHRNSSDLIMARISSSVYEQIPTKNQQGLPNQVWVNRLQNTVTLNIWFPSNITTDYLKVWYLTQPFPNQGPGISY